MNEQSLQGYVQHCQQTTTRLQIKTVISAQL